MPIPSHSPRIQTDGKFFRMASQRLWLKTITYGPFPKQNHPNPSNDFPKIKQAGFNSLRLFTLPNHALLNTAHENNLHVFAGLNWHQYQDFISNPSHFSAALVQLSSWLNNHANHPALAGIYVGNEIPSDLVRWMGPSMVRHKIEDLIAHGKKIAPHLLFAYANYPSTEYLEPENADFTAFNIYLEQRQSFSAYLRRLHNIAGDRPLLISEFGLDCLRNSPQIQADTLQWALHSAHQEETAGFTVYAWTDLWENNGIDIQDWQFGITDRHGKPKPALQICETFIPSPPPPTKHSYSIIVCTHNGSSTINSCLKALSSLTGGPHQIIVVDDGSTDQTSKIVSENFPTIRLIRIEHSGLSTARNIGASHSTGDIIAYTDDDCVPDPEWIARLDKAFLNPEIAAAGGPNLAPTPKSLSEAIVCASPGAPSHVLLDDFHAEHLPGCNIAIRRSAFNQIGGFDPAFRTAGDDVDLCWRLRDSNLQMAFVPGAFVWHFRRPSIRAFLKQQIGYGKAERILIKKHPHRFSNTGEALWDGFVYSGGTVTVQQDSTIYHGPMGQAGYQSICNRMLPLRPLHPNFQFPCSYLALKILFFIQSNLRRWVRNRTLDISIPKRITTSPPAAYEEMQLPNALYRHQILQHFLSENWSPGGNTDYWDLHRDQTKILIATEPLTADHFNHLIRIWGDPTPVIESLNSLTKKCPS